MKKYFIIFTLLLACGKPSHKPAEPKGDDRVEPVRHLFQQKKAELLAKSEQTSGWPSAEDCDGTLWAGLALVTGNPVKLGLAEYAPGEVHRRPLASGECYPDHSASTVSNDMLLGYLWGRWSEGNLAALQRLADYGEKNNWTMGQGDSFGTVFRPNGYGLLGRILYALSSGGDDRSYRKVAPLFLPVLEDYEKHLMVEGITLNGAVNEYLRTHGMGGKALGLLDVNSQDLDRLKELARDNPRDALFQSALGTYTGDFGPALDALLAVPTPVPSYVRGADTYSLVYWLKAAKLVLDRYPVQAD